MKYFSILIFCLFFMACNFKQTDSKVQKNEQDEAAMSIEQAMNIAAEKIEQEIKLKGVVNHVCAHSGKRCIIKNLEGNLSIRIEATGNLEGFSKEIVGRDILVTGLLREKRLDASYIDNWESELKIKEDAENEGEHCSSEMANIKEMRKWMKENNKDYYAIYYVDGTGYEIVE